MKTKSSTVIGDIPMKLIKEFGVELAMPIADILNRSIISGEYPNCWKLELVTPVPKVIPPATVKDLRKIVGLISLSKIAEKIISEYCLRSTVSQIGDRVFH